MTLIVSPAIPEDVLWLAPRLRQADLDEIAAASGEEPAQALRRGLEESEDCYSVVCAGSPIAMFGIVPERPFNGRGSPWLLGSDEVVRNWFPFARQSREWLRRISSPYTYLSNHVDERNILHRRWLEWLGATFVTCEPYGVLGLPFWRFEFRPADTAARCEVLRCAIP